MLTITLVWHVLIKLACFLLQDGIKLMVHPMSDISCDITGCQFELVLYEAESSAHAVYMNAGNCRAHNNVIFSNHIDPVRFYKFLSLSLSPLSHFCSIR